MTLLIELVIRLQGLGERLSTLVLRQWLHGGLESTSYLEIRLILEIRRGHKDSMLKVPIL